jgi:hypothetical protein
VVEGEGEKGEKVVFYKLFKDFVAFFFRKKDI